jgi:hypothetical protein
VCDVEQVRFLSRVARSCRQTPRLGSAPKAFGNGINAKRFRHISPRLKEPSGQPFGAVILFFSGSDFVISLGRNHSCSLDHFVGPREQRRRHFKAECLAAFRLITSSYFVGA